MTIAELYTPAMEITTQAKADAYFEKLVDLCLRELPELSRTQAEAMQRSNLGYYAGYYSHETRIRVEELFRCQHPVLPPARTGQLSPKEILAIGLEAGRQMRKEPAK
jgi:hypothetical protein